MPQEVLIHRISDLQLVNKGECEYLLTTVRDFRQLTLEEVDVGFEAISESHIDGEKVMGATLGFLARGILCEKDFSNLLEIMDRA